jgi:WD40 repeat protein
MITAKENKSKRRRIYLIASAIALFYTFFSAPLQSEVPSSKPVLRIETGMHTAAIGRIGVDAENRYLITGSHDKTVRVWELSTGRLIRVLRPAIGDGNEGMIYAVAISPDGNTIACGGWTAKEWTGSKWNYSIYIFDRETGRLIKRIEELPSVIYHLTFSKDREGKYLAATLGKNKGIRIYDTKNYVPVFSDINYGGDSYGADFDKDGRLVTTSDDGYIRLYEYKGNKFRLFKKQRAEGGNQPFDISFSPYSSKIAVGFYNSQNVDVLSAKDLSFLYSPDTSGVDNGNLASVAWSSDGKYLYAGGQYFKDKDNQFPILKWSDEGRGRYTDLKGANTTIMHILPLKDRGMVFGAAGPAFGIINKMDEQALFKKPSIADFRANYKGFLVSDDGATVQFGYEVRGKSPARFSIHKRLLEMLDEQKGTGEPEILSPPDTSSEDLKITDWKANEFPKLNGIRLELKPYEASRSLAISPDRGSFLLGTEWFLRLFDRQGKEIWNIPAPAVAWGVNIARNGKVAVAAFGDGTIRWYSMKDHKELLALFLHNDRKRWILWTPSGYYDASAAGDDLAGWHINNGMEQAADFFPVSRFRAKCYRPDVVARMLKTLNEDEAVRLADKETGRRPGAVETIEDSLPPVVNILSPKDGAEIRTKDVTVTYLIRIPSGAAVKSIEIRVNGNLVKTEKDLNLTEKEIMRTARISLPEKDSAITITAENSKKAQSVPASIQIRWTGKVDAKIDSRPRLYILAIGISNYEDKALKKGVEYASKDAKDFVDAILRQKGVFYRDIEVKPLRDKDAATRDDIRRGLEWIQKRSTQNDVAMIFISGHGDTKSNSYYFLPQKTKTSEKFITGMPYYDILEDVKNMQGTVILFIDTCYSGGIMGADIDGLVNVLRDAGKQGVVFASSTESQKSRQVQGNGAFTKALIEGLKGKAAGQGSTEISTGELGVYLVKRVKQLTNNTQRAVGPIDLSRKSFLDMDYSIAKKID